MVRGGAKLLAGVWLLGVLMAANGSLAAQDSRGANDGVRAGLERPADGDSCDGSRTASRYIPLDSWVYPAMLRLDALGMIDDLFLGMRPWTRASLRHALAGSAAILLDASQYAAPEVDEGQRIYDALVGELKRDGCRSDSRGAHLE